jgi:hypothetical protein
MDLKVGENSSPTFKSGTRLLLSNHAIIEESIFRKLNIDITLIKVNKGLSTVLIKELA